MKTYFNPRMEAIIPNWPSGGKRVTAIFFIETKGNKQRAARQTGETDATGNPTRLSKPKKLTYAAKARIVDGSDGRTYIAELTEYGFISIMRGNMKLQEETVFPTMQVEENGEFATVDNPRFHELKKLFDV